MNCRLGWLLGWLLLLLNFCGIIKFTPAGMIAAIAKYQQGSIEAYAIELAFYGSTFLEIMKPRLIRSAGAYRMHSAKSVLFGGWFGSED